VSIGFVALLAVLNLFGVDFISSISSVLATLILLLFVTIFIWAGVVGKLSPRNWIELPPGEWNADKFKSISSAFSVILWAYTGADSIGQVLEDLEDVDKNLVRTLLGGIALTMSTYLISIIGAVGVDTNYPNWTDGYFSVIAGMLGGNTLKTITIVGAMIGNIGIYNSLLLPAAEQLQALCGEHYFNIPFMRWKHPRWNTPMPAIIFCATVGAGLLTISFISLVEIQLLVYSIIVIVVCVCFVTLRIVEKGKNLTRPYKVLNSDSIYVAVLVAAGPITLSLYTIIGTAFQNWTYALCILLLWLLMAIWHKICGIRRELSDGYSINKSTPFDDNTIN